MLSNVNELHERIFNQQKLADNCIKYKNLIFFAKMASVHIKVKILQCNSTMHLSLFEEMKYELKCREKIKTTAQYVLV